MRKLMIALLASLIGSSSTLFAAGNKVVCEGSTTVLPIAQKAAEDFMDKNSGIDVTVRGGGSGVGITSLIEGRCNIANSSRPIKDAELQKAASRGIDAKAKVIAMDGIAVIVNPSNQVDELTKKQILDIYTGKLTNWSQLGGKNEKIIVISRDSASGTFEAFNELALNKQKVKPDALMQASNQAIAGIVSKTAGAIGYVGMGYLTKSVKEVRINGIAPSKVTVLSGKYPYSRPLFMYTNGDPKEAVKAFIDYILSPEGQRMVEEEGFIALK